MAAKTLYAPGPFRAEHVTEGSPYELSNGHPVYCLPTGQRGGKSSLFGGEVLETDPAVKSAGMDVGYSANPRNLRAPDVSVGDLADAPGWASGSPPLAVEYADTGQDEAELKQKIGELLAAGTKHIWVVRLVGPRRVEIHEPGRTMRHAHPGDDLVAPGILQNPVPVLALFDREAAHEATLRNLLQRRGYASLDAIRAEGELEGEARGEARGEAKGEARGEARGEAKGELKGLTEALLAVLGARGLAVSEAERKRITATTERALLDTWLVRAATLASTAAVLAPVKTRRKPR